MFPFYRDGGGGAVLFETFEREQRFIAKTEGGFCPVRGRKSPISCGSEKNNMGLLLENNDVFTPFEHREKKKGGGAGRDRIHCALGKRDEETGTRVFPAGIDKKERFLRMVAVGNEGKLFG